MCRAAALMKESLCIPDGFDMKLIKRIPSQAGLGGGSSDAAAVIKSINKLCSLNLSNEEMRKVAVKIGADVPFFIEGGTALCEGIGEKVTPVGREFAIERFDAVYTLIVKPPEGADTKEIYRLYDEYSEKTAILKGDETVYANVLEPITASLVKTVARIRRLIENQNAVYTAMSGSGTAVFGLFTDKDSMHNAAENIKNILPDAKIIQTELK